MPPSSLNLPVACIILGFLLTSGSAFVSYTSNNNLSERSTSSSKRSTFFLATANRKDDEDSNPAENFLRKLAQLSLEDYKWRSNIFKENEADRMLEESLARMRGEDASYLRPMDAGDKIGPLGRWEKATVKWLSEVIDEEGKRAKEIINLNGKLVRPLEANELGPLGRVERYVVDVLSMIRASEKERVKTKTIRPKDLESSVRGPLGDMEEEAVRIIEEIQKSERMRMEQSKSRGGEVVRPIDIPGPLGEFELAVSEIFQAEKYRASQRQRNGGKLVRPKDSSLKGPLGQVELSATDIITQLSIEEKQRLESLRRYLNEKRPMEAQQNSVLGIFESILVGIVRSPALITKVFERVVELLQSETLPLDQEPPNPRETTRSDRQERPDL